MERISVFLLLVFTISFVIAARLNRRLPPNVYRVLRVVAIASIIVLLVLSILLRMTRHV